MSRPGVEPVEDPQRGLGVESRLVVALPGKMDFGVIQEPETLEMDIPDCLGNVEALAEIPVGVVPQLAVRAHHAEIVVGDGASAVIADALEGHERLAIVRQRFGQGTLDVGQDPEILFGAPPELGAGYAQLERLVKLLPRLRDEAGLEVEARKRVQRLRGEHRVTHTGRGLVASLAQLAGDSWLVSQMVHHAQPAERFGQDAPLTLALGGADGRTIGLYRFSHGTGPLLSPGLT